MVSTETDWPVRVLVKCDTEPTEELRQYRPRSDFLISISSLPRLLVEVNSTSVVNCPPDLVRMLVTGAFIVRFANSFVGTFREAKDFVLCAIFIWDNGNAIRYTLFQREHEVGCALY